MILTNASLVGREGRWTIRVAGGKIAAVAQFAAAEAGAGPDADVLDLAGRLVHRPFIDIHLHLDKAYHSDAMPNASGTLGEAIELGRRIKRGLTEDDAYRRILQGARQALEHGSTRLRTHVDVDPIAGLKGVRAALRARRDLRGLVDLQIVSFPQEGITGQEGVADLLRESLTLGCDAIGGIPAFDSDPAGHIRLVFRLAAEFDVPVDMHVDESDDPDDLTLTTVAQETERHGLGGRVLAGHCCSLSAQTPETRAAVIEQVRAAGVQIATLPSTNLYLQGRGDQVNPRRGLTPVKELLAAGVNVVYGSDNVRDPFNPFGNGSMVQGGLILAHAAHMGGTGDLAAVFDMGTRRAAAVWSGSAPGDLPDYAVAAGAPADLVVWNADSPPGVIVDQAPPYLVMVGGETVVRREEKLSLSAAFPGVGQ